MGCATSKQEQRCRHCKTPPSAVPRSYSMHVHHPPQRKGDSYHVVALTSSTVKLQISAADTLRISKLGDPHPDKEQLAVGIIEAKAWSTMIDHKIPKILPRTPVRTPPGEPETINTWELMEGLEDSLPISPFHHRSFSFNLPRPPDHSGDPPKSSFQQPSSAAAAGDPLFLQIADQNPKSPSGFSEFDPEIIESFKNSFQKIDRSPPAPEKLVLYYTTLRGVRKTYEDCCHVRTILKGIGVKVDERDVSMHSGFKEELRELMGEGYRIGAMPRLFIGESCVGGAEEIRRLHEEGKLEKILESWKEESGGECEGCGDVRFVPCENCSGSCKIYNDDIEEEEEEEEETEECGFQRCPDCNENGLIRCNLCCY